MNQNPPPFRRNLPAEASQRFIKNRDGDDIMASMGSSNSAKIFKVISLTVFPFLVTFFFASGVLGSESRITTISRILLPVVAVVCWAVMGRKYATIVGREYKLEYHGTYCRAELTVQSTVKKIAGIAEKTSIYLPRVTLKSISENKIQYLSSPNLSSWGSEIILKLSSSQAGEVRIKVESRPIQMATAVDYGQAGRDILTILRSIQRNLNK